MLLDILNPVTEEKKIASIANWCNENGVSSHALVDLAASLNLVYLLQEEINGEQMISLKRVKEYLNYASTIGKFLMEQCTDDKQRILSVGFLLKAIITSHL